MYFRDRRSLNFLCSSGFEPIVEVISIFSNQITQGNAVLSGDKRTVENSPLTPLRKFLFEVFPGIHCYCGRQRAEKQMKIFMELIVMHPNPVKDPSVPNLIELLQYVEL